MGPMDAEVSGFSLKRSVVLEGQVGAFVYGCGTLRLLAAACCDALWESTSSSSYDWMGYQPLRISKNGPTLVIHIKPALHPESQQRTGGNMTSPAGKTRAIHADCPHDHTSITNFMEPSPEDHVSFAGAFWKAPLPLFPDSPCAYGFPFSHRPFAGSGY